MRGGYALLEREMLRYLKVWTQTLVPPVLQATLFIFIFGVSLGTRIEDINGVPYLQFIAPGLVMMGIINAAYSNTSTSLYDARMRTYVEDVLTAPISDFELASAYIAGAASRGLITGLLTMGVIALFADVAWTSIGLVLYYATAVSIIFGCMGAWFGLWGDLWDHVFLPLTFLLTPLTFLGGVFYSVDMLPGFWSDVSRFNPIFYMVDGLRYGMVGISDAPVWPGAITIGIFAVASFLWTVFLFKRGYKLRGETLGLRKMSKKTRKHPTSWKAWRLLFWATVVHVVLLVWTAFWPTLGAPVWHHNASLAGALAIVLVTLRPFARSRAYLAIALGLTTLLAVGSGFLLLYLKQDLKDWLLKDWAKWWHIAWSWLALFYFIGHTWINRAPLVRWWTRMHKRVDATLVHHGILLAILVAIPVTWGQTGRAWFTDANYIPMTLVTWLALAGPPYAAWAIVTWRFKRGAAPMFRQRWARGRVVAVVDVGLFPMTILANVSGFPILYFNTKAGSLKYVAKYWHTWPSIAMTILVFAHTVMSWPAVAAHWRRFDSWLRA